jgi:anti-anti-sigma factor
VLRLAGELDLATAEQLKEQLKKQAGSARVVVDLAGLEFLDVTGLNVLLEGHRTLASRGGRLVLRRPRPMVVRLLTLLDLSDAIEIEP